MEKTTNDNAILTVAAAALQGMLSNPSIVAATTLTPENTVTLAHNALEFAYAFMKIHKIRKGDFE